MTSSTPLVSTHRIEIADVLRGFAVLGITLIHFIERFSVYSYPEETNPILLFTDRAIWDSIYFTISGKAYCIFALLFGFSFFIQDNAQQLKGKDFRGRFAWRLVLLFLFACVNSMLFPGEILMLYALLGYVLIFVCRLSTRTVAWIAVVLLLQPLELFQIVSALLDPAYTFNTHFDAPYWELVAVAQKEGSFLEMCKTAIWTGNVGNFGWMILYGRVTQTAGLFMVGMLIGRRGLLLYSEQNISLWMKVFITSVFAFFPLYGLMELLPEFITREALLFPSTLFFKALSNLSFTALLFSGIILLYYQTACKGWFQKMAPYGRMSLTIYLSQSLIGGFLFYNWGLGLYQYTGITASLLIGIAVFALQFLFCRWWLRSHRQGPLEWLWKKGTWI